MVAPGPRFDGAAREVSGGAQRLPKEAMLGRRGRLARQGDPETIDVAGVARPPVATTELGPDVVVRVGGAVAYQAAQAAGPAGRTPV